jgi:hypothetical protein
MQIQQLMRRTAIGMGGTVREKCNMMNPGHSSNATQLQLAFLWAYNWLSSNHKKSPKKSQL